jgi:TolA-binding protein
VEQEMDLTQLKISKMRNTLTDLSNKNQKAIAQEEILLKQLEEEFEVDNLEDGYELYEQLVEEKKGMEKKVAKQTDTLYDQLIAEGLIDA